MGSSSFFGSGRLHFLGHVVFIFRVRSSLFSGQVVFIFWVRLSLFFGSGHLHFLGQVVLFFGSGRLHFLGQVVFIFWVRSSSFFGSGRLTTWKTQSQHQDRRHCCQYEFTCTYRSLDRSLGRSLGLQPIRSQIRRLEKEK